MRTKHLFVLIHTRNKGEVDTCTIVLAIKFFFRLLTVPRRCFFFGSFLLFMFRVCNAVLSVHCSRVFTCWERANLLCVMFSCVFITFSCGALGQVWSLIVSIPDLCLYPSFSSLVYFVFMCFFVCCFYFILTYVLSFTAFSKFD